MRSDKYAFLRTLSILCLGAALSQSLLSEKWVIAALVCVGTVGIISAYQKAVKDVIADARGILNERFQCADCGKFSNIVVHESVKRRCLTCHEKAVMTS